MVLQVNEGTMVKPGFLQNDEVADWLGGIEPMWTHLEFESYCRLRRRPDEDDRAMHLATDLSEAEGRASPIAVALLALLQMAGETGGAKLTTGGSLSRAVITPIAEICDGPAYDLALMRSVTKVLNEADVWPAELLRHVGTELGLFRRVGRSLVLTRKGRAVLSAGAGGDLVAKLFSTVFWRINLGHWDGYPIPTWPQSDIGVIAWSLAHAAALGSPPRFWCATLPSPSSACWKQRAILLARRLSCAFSACWRCSGSSRRGKNPVPPIGYFPSDATGKRRSMTDSSRSTL